MKQSEVYKNYPEVLGYFSMKDGKIFFDINDSKISVAEMMVINANLINEYVKSIASMQTQQEQK
jgi:hypothetical protein